MDSLKQDPGAAIVHVGSELDGPISGFGNRVARVTRMLMDKVGIDTADVITGLDYEDRYLRSPLTVKLLVEALGALAMGAGKTVPVVIRTVPLEPREDSPRWFDSNWKREDDRAVVARLFAQTKALALEWRTGAAGHARKLTITFASGRRAQILLDQGFGPWTCRGTSFEFRASPAEQAGQLRRLDRPVQISPGARTFLVAAASSAVSA